MARGTKYNSLTETTFASGSSVSIAQGGATDAIYVDLPLDFQIRLACDIQNMLYELRKTNMYLAEILGDEIK